MYSLTHFSLREMIECGMALRKLGQGATTMEEAAQNMVQFFYNSFQEDGAEGSAFALVRFFKVLDYGSLSAELQQIAQHRMGKVKVSDHLKCLVLLGTVGDRPEWNDRRLSIGHQAIPLPSEQIVAQAPMIAQLIQQLGLSISAVVAPDPNMIVDLEERTFNVFHILAAQSNPYIPAQVEFVKPYGIQSVLGFGGILPSGSLMVIILFSKVLIQRETAELFKPLALNAKMAVLSFDQGQVFNSTLG